MSQLLRICELVTSSISVDQPSMLRSLSARARETIMQRDGEWSFRQLCYNVSVSCTSSRIKNDQPLGNRRERKGSPIAHTQLPKGLRPFHLSAVSARVISFWCANSYSRQVRRWQNLVRSTPVILTEMYFRTYVCYTSIHTYRVFSVTVRTIFQTLPIVKKRLKGAYLSVLYRLQHAIKNLKKFFFHKEIKIILIF